MRISPHLVCSQVMLVENTSVSFRKFMFTKKKSAKEKLKIKCQIREFTQMPRWSVTVVTFAGSYHHARSAPSSIFTEVSLATATAKMLAHMHVRPEADTVNRIARPIRETTADIGYEKCKVWQQFVNQKVSQRLLSNKRPVQNKCYSCHISRRVNFFQQKSV